MEAKSKINPVLRKIYVYNPSQWSRSSLVDCIVHFDSEVTNIQVYNHNNQEITAQISKISNDSWNFRFVAENIPARGKIVYFIKHRDIAADFLPPAEGLLDGNDYYLENDKMRVVLEEDGSLTIMQREEKTETDDGGNSETNANASQKIIAMGEELTEGSIWAGESFFNYRNINRILCNSTPIKGYIQSKLKEAGDFQGKIKVEYSLAHNKTEKDEIEENAQINSKFSLFFSLEKGDSRYITISIPFIAEIISNHIMIANSIPFSNFKHQITQNFGVFWDENAERGLLILQPYFEILHKLEGNRLELDINKYFEAQPNINFEYALVPLNKSDFNNGNLNEESIQRLIFDYYHDFEVEIE